MGQKQDARTLYTINCSCGAAVSLDARGFGRPIVCKQCGGSFTVAWGNDAKTRKAAPVAVSLARKRAPTPLRVVCSCGYRRAVTASEAAGHNRCPGCGKVMIVEKPPSPKARESDRMIKLSSAPHTSSHVIKPPPSPAANPTPSPVAGSRTPTPLPGGFTKPGLTCECGRELEIVKAFDAKGTVCPACGRTATMEKIRAPQSKHTVIRPRFTAKGAAPAPPPPKAQPPPVLDVPTAEFTEDAPVSYEDTSTQAVFCPCGESLTVASEDVGKNLQCPTCLTLMAVDQLRDPKTRNYVLRVRAIGKMDQDTWSLNDFA